MVFVSAATSQGRERERERGERRERRENERAKNATTLEPRERTHYQFLGPDFLYSRVTGKHVKEEDSCSQTSPLKNYIKRMNHLPATGLTRDGWGRVGYLINTDCFGGH